MQELFEFSIVRGGQFLIGHYGYAVWFDFSIDKAFVPICASVLVTVMLLQVLCLFLRCDKKVLSVADACAFGRLVANASEKELVPLGFQVMVLSRTPQGMLRFLLSL